MIQFYAKKSRQLPVWQSMSLYTVRRTNDCAVVPSVIRAGRDDPP